MLKSTCCPSKYAAPRSRHCLRLASSCCFFVVHQVLFSVYSKQKQRPSFLYPTLQWPPCEQVSYVSTVQGQRPAGAVGWPAWAPPLHSVAQSSLGLKMESKS